MKRFLLAALLAMAFMAGGAAPDAEADHGSPTYCDRFRNRMRNDTTITLPGDQIPWILNQRGCTYSSSRGHWLISSVVSCDTFRYRVGQAPFTLSNYEEARIFLHAEC